MRLRAGIDGIRRHRRDLGRNRPFWIIPCVVIGVLTVLVWLATSAGDAADPMPDSHAAHHPGAGAPGAPSPGTGGMEEMMKGMMSPSAPPGPSPPPDAPGQAAPTEGAAPMPPAAAPPAMSAAGMGNGGPSGGGMGAGGCCGGAGPKPFYASLMTMPSLTPEARLFIEVESSKRLGAGSEQITTGQTQLHSALAASDGAAVQQAAAIVGQGLYLVESGASAQQAMNEGQLPPQIALTWFKGQSSVPVAGGMSMGDGPWGLSWLHLLTMAFVIAFLAGALLIHFGRARRIAGLVERLGGGASAAAKLPDKPASTPALAATGAPAANSPGAVASGTPAPPQPTAPPADTPKKPWSGNLCVAAIFQETPIVKTFRLMDPDRGDIPFTFLPGQFLTFSAEIHGKRIRRSYTIASSPSQRDYVEITVKREEQGAESRYLHDNVAVGDLLEVSGPSGIFTFTGKEAGSVVLIAGGVGITPMMCVTRYLTDGAYPGDIFFLYGARTTQDLIFREEIEYLQKRHANLHFAATLSHAEEDSWPGAKGRISKEFIAHSVPDIARRRVHVCGPPPLMEAVKGELAELGVSKEKIKTEAFGPALGAAVSPVAAPPVAPQPVAAAPVPAAPAVPAAASAQATVQFSKSGKSGALAPGQSVLEAAEAIGVAIDFSCRVGTCGTCVVPLTSGTVTMEVEDGLPPDQKAKGIILACQAKSAGNLVVDA